MAPNKQVICKTCNNSMRSDYLSRHLKSCKKVELRSTKPSNTCGSKKKVTPASQKIGTLSDNSSSVEAQNKTEDNMITEEYETSATIKLMISDPELPIIINAKHFNFKNIVLFLMFLIKYVCYFSVTDIKIIFILVVECFEKIYNVYPAWIFDKVFISNQKCNKCNNVHIPCKICHYQFCTVSHKCWIRYYTRLNPEERQLPENCIIGIFLERNMINRTSYNRFFTYKTIMREDKIDYSTFAEMLETSILRKYQRNLLTLMNNTVQRNCRKVIIIVDSIGNNGKTYLSKLLLNVGDVASLTTIKYINFNIIQKKTAELLKWFIIDIPRSTFISQTDKISAYRNIEDITNGLFYNRQRYQNIKTDNIGTIIHMSHPIDTLYLNDDKIKYQIEIEKIIHATEEELKQDIYTFVKNHLLNK